MRQALIVAALAALLVPAVAEAKVKAGDRAPDFALKDKAGKTVKLSDLRGNVVVVDFWTSWCAPCKKEVPAMEGLARKYGGAKKNVVFVAINYDKARENADKWLSNVSITSMTLLFDQDKSTTGTYDPGPPLPGSYLIDEKGIVRYTHDGFQSGDEATMAQEVDKLIH